MSNRRIIDVQNQAPSTISSSEIDEDNDVSEEETETLASSSATTTTPTTTTEKRKVGRKLGKLPQYFICAGINSDNKIIMTPCLGTTPVEAKKEFLSKNGFEATEVATGNGSGFFLIQKKVNNGSTSTDTISEEEDKPTVIVSTSDLKKRNDKMFRGVFQGWNVMASGIDEVIVNGKKYASNELVQVFFLNAVDSTKAKPKLKADMLVKRNKIENIVEVVQAE